MLILPLLNCTALFWVLGNGNSHKDKDRTGAHSSSNQQTITAIQNGETCCVGQEARQKASQEGGRKKEEITPLTTMLQEMLLTCL